jgi:hypothetical protein
MTEPQPPCRIANAMKHVLLVSAAAMLLSACDTMTQGQSYPPPAYPGGAYPQGSYPPATYPPANYPPGPYPPGQTYPAPNTYPAPYPAPYPAGPQLSCPIATSQNWKAWVNVMPGPGRRPTLIVTGKVVTASPGYQISFDPRLQVRKTYPAQAFATLRVMPPPGAAPQALFSQDVHWEWPLRQPLGSVEIRCGNETLAHIEPVATAQ